MYGRCAPWVERDTQLAALQLAVQLYIEVRELEISSKQLW